MPEEEKVSGKAVATGALAGVGVIGTFKLIESLTKKVEAGEPMMLDPETLALLAAMAAGIEEASKGVAANAAGINALLAAAAGLPSAGFTKIEELIRCTSNPFKLAEFLGYSRGITPQCMLRLAPGETFELTVYPDEDKVWWWTLCSAGDIPASSMVCTFKTSAETMARIYEAQVQEVEIVFDEAWINQPLCPPGWRRIDNYFTIHWRNVTGDPTYNDLAPQEIFFHCTVFILEMYKPFVEKLESILGPITVS